MVVKNYPATAEGADSFAAEAAGLALAAQAGAGPRLLAASSPARLVVMSDLGDAPSLADVLLTGSAAAAEAALLDWARACGELAVATAGRQPELAALRGAPSLRLPGPDAGPAAGGGAGSAAAGLRRMASALAGTPDLRDTGPARQAVDPRSGPAGQRPGRGGRDRAVRPA